MKKADRLLTGCLVAAFVLAGAVAGPAMAQEKAKAAVIEATIKVILENDKVRVTETTWKPGAETPSVARPNRVVRALKGGTLTRIYPDGKTETVTNKTGEVKYIAATPPYIVKNNGKTEIVLYGVALK